MEQKKVPVKKIAVSILTVIALILAVLLVLTIRKVSIIKELLATAAETDKNTNCYVQIDGNGDVEAYVKGDNFKAIDKQPNDTFNYYGEFEGVAYMATDFQKVGQKTYLEQQGKYISLIRTITPYIQPEFLWQTAVESKIISTECNGKDCYEVRLAKDLIIWVEKETGLVVRELNVNTTKNYSYKFGIVTDADVQMPDFSDYEKY